MKNAFLFVLLTAAFISCTDDDNQPSMNLKVGIAPSVVDVAETIEPYKGSELSLSFCSSEDVGNLPSTLLNTRWSGSGGVWNSSDEIYWNTEMYYASFYAYAPYIEGLSIKSKSDLQNISYEVALDQNTEESFIKSDLVSFYRKGTEPESLENGVLSFIMSHRLSMIDVKFVFKDTYKGNKEIDNIIFHARNSFSFNVTNNDEPVVDVSEGIVDIVPFNGTADNECKVILPPQEISETFMSFTIDGLEYTYSPQLPYKLLGNKKTNITLTIGNSDIVIGDISVSDWDEKNLVMAPSGDWTDNASENEPGKSSDGYYLINSAEDLAWIARYKNPSVETDVTDRLLIRLNSDIDLSGNYWVPININNEVQSVFDGNNKTISGLTTSVAEDKIYRGFFGHVNNLVIKNLIIDSPSISAKNNSLTTSEGKVLNERLGVIAGKTIRTSMFNVHINNASFMAASAGVNGGLVGELSDLSLIYACSFDGIIDYPLSIDDKQIRLGSMVGTLGKSMVLGNFSSGEFRKHSSSGFINVFIGAATALADGKAVLGANYSSSNLNGLTSKMYVTVNTSLAPNAVIEATEITPPESVEELNTCISKYYEGVDISVGDEAMVICPKENSEYYIFAPNEDSATKDKIPFILKQSNK